MEFRWSQVPGAPPHRLEFLEQFLLGGAQLVRGEPAQGAQVVAIPLEFRPAKQGIGPDGVDAVPLEREKHGQPAHPGGEFLHLLEQGRGGRVPCLGDEVEKGEGLEPGEQAVQLFQVADQPEELGFNRYTLLNRSAEPLLDVLVRRGVAVLNAAPYGSGILAKGPEAYPRYAYQDAAGATLERARNLAAVCAQYGVPLGAAALQFSLREPRIAATIIGMTRPERIAQTVELAQQAIPAAIWQQLDAQGFDTADPEADRFK